MFSWQFHILLIKDFEENAVVKYKALPYNERNYSNFPIVRNCREIICIFLESMLIYVMNEFSDSGGHFHGT